MKLAPAQNWAVHMLANGWTVEHDDAAENPTEALRWLDPHGHCRGRSGSLDFPPAEAMNFAKVLARKAANDA